MSAHASNPLWVITSYFNPTGSKRRRDNYNIFRQNLNAPLLTVELARPGRHQLGSHDADKLIQLNGEAYIWQKERLLNIATSELPAHVRHVAWVDCDVVFEDEHWACAAQAELERDGGLLHLFSRAVHLPKDLGQAANAREMAALVPIITEQSMGHAASNGYGLAALHACYNKSSPRSHGNTCATGMALAARRDTLQACGLYDGAIVGGGDAILICAAMGQLDRELMGRQANSQEFHQIQQWADRARAAGLFTRLRDLEQTIYHLWHGELTDRKYGKRHDITSALDFDPGIHLRLAHNQTWEWADPDGELARRIKDYFISRREG